MCRNTMNPMSKIEPTSSAEHVYIRSRTHRSGQGRASTLLTLPKRLVAQTDWDRDSDRFVVNISSDGARVEVFKARTLGERAEGRKAWRTGRVIVVEVRGVESGVPYQVALRKGSGNGGPRIVFDRLSV